MARFLGSNQTGGVINVVFQKRDPILLTDDQRRKVNRPSASVTTFGREASHRHPLFRVHEDAPAPIERFVRRGLAVKVEKHARCRRRG